MSQTAELSRVSTNIRGHIIAFTKERLQWGQPKFRMPELHDYIRRNARVAPASPDRVLRQLRKQGVVSYQVVNRAASEYELLAVCE